MKTYAKALVAVGFAAATSAQAVNLAGDRTVAGYLAVITAALGALGVYLVPNTPVTVNATAGQAHPGQDGSARHG